MTAAGAAVVLTAAALLSTAAAGAGGSAPGAVTSGNGGAYEWGLSEAGHVIIPAAVAGLPGGVKQVAGTRCGMDAALMTDGTVQTWGTGALGDGADHTAFRGPAPVPGLAGITQIAVECDSVLAVGPGGSVWAWGDDSFGQLGDGGTARRLSPFQVPGLSAVTQVALGAQAGAAVRSDGTLTTWGTGMLGDGNTSTRRLPGPVPNLTGVTQVAIGAGHGMAVRSDKTLWTWGLNRAGQLGLGDEIDRLVPTKVPGLANVTSISAGCLYSLAVAGPNSSAWSWGANFAQDIFGDFPMGQLGDGTEVHHRNTPFQLPLTGIVQVSAGTDGIWASSAAIDQAGQLWTWGSNGFGQLGIGSNDPNRLAPVKVTAIPPVQQISIDVRAVAVMSNVSVLNPGPKTAAAGAPIAPFTLTALPTASYTWSATGLPPGLTLNATTGTISGTPTTPGTYGVAVTATSANGSGRTTFTFTVTSGCANPGQQLRNPGFESGAVVWSATAGVIAQSGPAQPPHAGTWTAWLDGDGTAHTDTISQSVTIPAGCVKNSLTFWLHIDTAETGTGAVDTLTVKLGTTTIGAFSNLNHTTGYVQRTISLGGAFAGQTLPLSFTGTENAGRQTSFVLDDITLTTG